MSLKSTIGRIVQKLPRWAGDAIPSLSARMLALLFTRPMSRAPSARETGWMAASTPSRLSFEGGRLVVHTWGDGPVVLLVHGWSGNASQLGLYAEPLVALGFRVVAFDGPAHGSSDGRLSSLPQFARAIREVADQVGPVSAIVAHSLGSAATTLALSDGLDAERVVYLAPPEDLPGYLARLGRRIGFGPDIAVRAQRLLEARFGAPFEQARGRHLAPSMTARLLAFHDARDREVPHAEGQLLVDRWPGARLVTTDGLGHNRILADPGVADQAVAFAGGLE